MSLLAASVWLHERRVGELRQDDVGYIEFHPDPRWLEDSERPVLGQWFEQRPGRRQRGERPGDLPSFFANLIPESDLGLILRDRLGIAPDDDLGLLIAVGEDLPGAVVVRAEMEDGAAARPIPERAASESASEHPRLRFSLAGVQLKFSMLRSGDRFHFPGRTSAATGSPRSRATITSASARTSSSRWSGPGTPASTCRRASSGASATSSMSRTRGIPRRQSTRSAATIVTAPAASTRKT